MRAEGPRPDTAQPLLFAERLTLLALLLAPGVRFTQRVPVVLLAGLGLVWPQASRRAGLWLALFACFAVRLVSNWPHSDNHDYLMAWWLLALAIARALPDPREAAARSARALLAAAFGLALLWKAVLSPDFASGAFFRATLLFDSRFEDFARLFAGVPAAVFEANERALETGGGGPWVEPAALWRLAVAMTAWTLCIEGAVAIGFLARCLRPHDARVAAFAHGALLLFCASTYAAAPVAGFGWLLVALGAGALGALGSDRRWQLAHLATFALVLLHAQVPWIAWAARSLAPAGSGAG